RREIVERLARRDDEIGVLARNPRELGALIRRTTSRGYGVRTGGERRHTKSISVPIILGDRVMGCMCLIWIASALSVDEAARRYYPELKAVAEQIAAAIDTAYRAVADSRRKNRSRSTIAAA